MKVEPWKVDQMRCKSPRISRNGNGDKINLHSKMAADQYQEEEGSTEQKEVTARRGGAVEVRSTVGRFYGWHSSRIVRVSRATGGKDRHSKVLTSKGLRDRRVRLSVNTAIQFYDLQDRLGYDQPSKAVEWLLKAAATSIQELPPMNTPFPDPDTPKRVSNEKRSGSGGSDQLGFDSAETINGGGDTSYTLQNQATKSSACSSNSETSKNSGLSISRSESRTQARAARAKERVAEKKKLGKDQIESSPVDSLNPISHTISFTELLTGALHNVCDIDNNHYSMSPNSSVHQTPNDCSGTGNSNQLNFFLKSPRQWASTSTSIDCFTGGLLGLPATRPGQMQFLNSLRRKSTVAGGDQSEIPTFSFAPDHFSVDNSDRGGHSESSTTHHNSGGEYNLNFTVCSSSDLTGFDRGTLQSNTSSASLLPPVHRFPPAEGSPPSFFIGATAPLENHHQFLPGFDARRQLYYGDNGRHPGHKGEGKNRFN